MNRGLITRVSAQRLLDKYRVPITPASKAYAGEPDPPEKQEKLL